MLADRFGPVPDAVHELVRSFRLRWQAQELGIEKLVLKSNKMIGYFISNAQSPFYESPVFTKILDFMQRHPSRAKLNEKNDRLRIIMQDVDSLGTAFQRLTMIINT
jgi:transcription-repair coupling factor (superfamily II helicase)